MSHTPHSPDDAKVEMFAQLLATCQRKVFLYALGLIHNATDAEEILQETNVVLWRKFDSYRPGTSFENWACRIALFEVMKFRRKKARRRHLLSGEIVDTLAAEVEQAWDEWDDRREALGGCLLKLSDKDRHLVLDRYQPGASTRSVAASRGRSVQGTRKSLHRIRTTLLACIERTLRREHPP